MITQYSDVHPGQIRAPGWHSGRTTDDDKPVVREEFCVKSRSEEVLECICLSSPMRTEEFQSSQPDVREQWRRRMEKIEFFGGNNPHIRIQHGGEAFRAEFNIVTCDPSTGQTHTLYLAAPDELTRKTWISTIRRVICSLVSLALPRRGLSLPPPGHLPLGKFSTAQLRAKCEEEGIDILGGSRQQMRAALDSKPSRACSSCSCETTTWAIASLVTICSTKGLSRLNRSSRA